MIADGRKKYSSRKWSSRFFRRNSVVVFAADDREGVDLAIELSQFLQHGGSNAALVFLVHAVQERQPLLGSIDDVSRVTASPQRRAQKANNSDPGSRFTHRAVEDCDVEGHGDFSSNDVRHQNRSTCSQTKIPNDYAFDARWLSSAGERSVDSPEAS